MADEIRVGGQSPCARYDVRVRSVVGPPVRAYVARGGRCAMADSGVVLRLRLTGHWDLVSLYDHLVASDIEVVGIRRLT